MPVFRQELKFTLAPQEAELLSFRLSRALPRDPNAGANGLYTVRSAYFDDLYNTVLFEKIMGVNDRVKYRLRLYNGDENLIRLEKKSRREGCSYKESMALSREDTASLLSGTALRESELPDPLLQGFLLFFKRGASVKAVIEYDREAYVYPAGNVRVTLDRHLRVSHTPSDFLSPAPTTFPVSERALTVLEIKYDRFLPDFIQDLLQGGSYNMRESVSKYALGRRFA